MRPLNATVSFSSGGTQPQKSERGNHNRRADQSAGRSSTTSSVKVASLKLIGGLTLSFTCSLRNSFNVKLALRIGKSGSSVLRTFLTRYALCICVHFRASDLFPVVSK